MNAIKSFSKNILFDGIMVIISIYFSFDYYNLSAAGDESIRRKIVLFVWLLAIIGWTIKFIIDLKNKEKYDN